jgi:hypothetical protein
MNAARFTAGLALVCVSSAALAQTRSLAGRVVDSVSNAPVPGARVSVETTDLSGVADANGRFSIAGVTAGRHTLLIRTASLDSLRASHRVAVSTADSATRVIRVPNAALVTAALCGSAPSNPGIVYGTVEIGGESTKPSNARVRAEWNDGTQFAETRTGFGGEYRLCGVPLDLPIQVNTLIENTNAAPYPVRVPANGRTVRVDLSVDRQSETNGVFTGVVHVDSSRTPVPNAEVILTEGRFRITDVPAGDHEVAVRRVGYSPLVTRLTFKSGESVERRIALNKIVTLDSVVTRAVRNAPNDFEEHRKLGLGHFLTRADIAKVENSRLDALLAMVPGLGLARGRMNAYVLSKRRPPSLAKPVQGATPFYVPEDHERRMGVIAGCYAQVYVDNTLMNPERPTTPFDVNTIPPSSIEAIEFYSGPSQLPLKYAKLNSDCGVLVIHTRR